MRVLVTGASGLIGRHTVEVLLREGHQVRTFQRSPLTRAADDRADQTHAAGDRAVETAVESVVGNVRTDMAKAASPSFTSPAAATSPSRAATHSATRS